MTFPSKQKIKRYYTVYRLPSPPAQRWYDEGNVKHMPYAMASESDDVPSSHQTAHRVMGIYCTTSTMDPVYTQITLQST